MRPCKQFLYSHSCIGLPRHQSSKLIAKSVTTAGGVTRALGRFLRLNGAFPCSPEAFGGAVCWGSRSQKDTRNIGKLWETSWVSEVSLNKCIEFHFSDEGVFNALELRPNLLRSGWVLAISNLWHSWIHRFALHHPWNCMELLHLTSNLSQS